jgi:hypothetical protein
MCIYSLVCLKINQYSTGLFCQLLTKKTNCTKVIGTLNKITIVEVRKNFCKKSRNLESFVNETGAPWRSDRRVLQLFHHQRPEPRVKRLLVGLAVPAADAEIPNLAESRDVLRERGEPISNDSFGGATSIPGIGRGSEDVGVERFVKYDDCGAENCRPVAVLRNLLQL